MEVERGNDSEERLSEKNSRSLERRRIIHEGRCYAILTMEKWYWVTLNWMTTEEGYSFINIIAVCERLRGNEPLDKALRVYIDAFYDTHELARFDA